MLTPSVPNQGFVPVFMARSVRSPIAELHKQLSLQAVFLRGADKRGLYLGSNPLR